VPQCIHTPHSSLAHILTATLHPTTSSRLPVSKTLTVHTKRYTSHTHNIPLSPLVHTLDNPARVEVELPRDTFHVGEPIPVYVTIPSPPRDLVVNAGLRLRNVKTELIRSVKARRGAVDEHEPDSDDEADADEGPSADQHAQEGSSSMVHSAEKLQSPLFMGASYRTVVSKSGASCRFHSSRAIKLRFVLHQSSPSASPSDHTREFDEYRSMESDTQCVSITQTTLLHTVTFRLFVHVSFVDTTNHTERLFSIAIPLNMIPPPAPLPQVEQSMDAAYQKKHDRPPAMTVRHEDNEASAPHYQEGEAGPSYVNNSAPPPFEDRDQPPPPFSQASPSTSSRLPTFLESEVEILVPEDAADHLAPPPLPQPMIPGEGVLFGFPASQHFDGHAEDTRWPTTPPPSLEMATQDTDVTELADMGQPVRAVEALGLVLDRVENSSGDQPPPPPALDDPADPPPSIDSDFRMPGDQQHSSSPSPGINYSQSEQRQSPPPHISNVEGHLPHPHAPPPYLNPGSEHESENALRPPPYADLDMAPR